MAEMDSAWEKAINSALKKCPNSQTHLTLDSSIKSTNGFLPSPSILSVLPKTLQSLSIANCRLSSLQNFPSFPYLKALNLSDNRISNGLDWIVKAGLGKLEELDLSNNRVSSVKELEVLGELKGLRDLDLYECPVTKAVGYREKVFGVIKGLKFLDKVDKDGNERPDSDEEEEEEEEEEEGEGEEEEEGDEEGDDEEEGEEEGEEEEDEEENEDGEEDNEVNEEEEKSKKTNGAPPSKRKREGCIKSCKVQKSSLITPNLPSKERVEWYENFDVY